LWKLTFLNLFDRIKKHRLCLLHTIKKREKERGVTDSEEGKRQKEERGFCPEEERKGGGC